MRGSELTIRHRLEAYATLTRRMVAVGFGSDGASLYRRGSDGASPYHFYVSPNFFTHIPNRTRR
jgi:hypothetical protein